MTQERNDRKVSRFVMLALGIIALYSAVACTNQGEQARLAIEQHLKNQSVQEVKLDLFQAGAVPDKAYASVTVTHNFANAEGKPQQEFLGYILKREGQSWIVERSAGYTKEEQKAKTFLAGGK